MKAPVLSSSSSPLADALSTRAWLALGAVLVAIAAYRWGVPLAAWIAPVPFLVVMRRAGRPGGRWRTRLLVLAVLTVATTIQVGKIMTAPLPLALALPFALPAALTGWVILVATETARRRAGELAAIAAYVGLTGLGEWLSYSYSPLGLWGSAASTTAPRSWR